MDVINFISDDKKLSKNINYHGNIKLYRVEVEFLSPDGVRMHKDVNTQPIQYKNSSFKKALTLFLCRNCTEQEINYMASFGAKLINVNGTKN